MRLCAKILRASNRCDQGRDADFDFSIFYNRLMMNGTLYHNHNRKRMNAP